MPDAIALGEFPVYLGQVQPGNLLMRWLQRANVAESMEGGEGREDGATFEKGPTTGDLGGQIS
jgi:hypothetical protein